MASTTPARSRTVILLPAEARRPTNTRCVSAPGRFHPSLTMPLPRQRRTVDVERSVSISVSLTFLHYNPRGVGRDRRQPSAELVSNPPPGLPAMTPLNYPRCVGDLGPRVLELHIYPFFVFICSRHICTTKSLPAHNGHRCSSPHSLDLRPRPWGGWGSMPPDLQFRCTDHINRDSRSRLNSMF
jgi:hypothetical protein